MWAATALSLWRNAHHKRLTPRRCRGKIKNKEKNMKRLKFLYAGMPVLLALVMVLMSCPGPDEGTNSKPASTALQAFPISTHPTSADYLLGGNPAVKDLVVKEGITEGTMSYQWYEVTTFTNSDGTAITDATTATYTPSTPTDAGEKFYYAVITNKRSGEQDREQASNPARVRFLAQAPEAPAVTVNVTTNNDQYVRGFGGMSNAFEIGGTGARYMEMRDIDTMFNPETGLGFNILRIFLWYQPLNEIIARKWYPQMGNQIYYEIVKRVNQYGGYAFACPWTPPPQWKVNESEAGTKPSYLLERHYRDYADHLRNFAMTMYRNGAPIYGLSLQNEFTFPASYQGCEWTGAQNVAFLQAAGDFLKSIPGYGGGKDIDQVKMMSAEPHQNVTANDPVKNNAATHKLTDIYSYHQYGNYNNPYRDVQADNDNNRKEVWMTEHNVNSGEGLEAQDYTWDYVWLFVDELDHVIRCNSSNAFVWWYLKRYYCMVGDNAYGTVNGQIQPRGYAMSHWAKYATDTVRVAATVTGHPGGGNGSDAQNTGFNNQTGVNVKASAFRRKATPVTYVEQQVQIKEDSISVVIFDRRTAAGAEGQNIRINLPADFEATYAHAIISDNNRKHAPVLVTLAADGKTADVFLPANSIISVKFTKADQ
jgi:O-glycosyl hydrolase